MQPYLMNNFEIEIKAARLSQIFCYISLLYGLVFGGLVIWLKGKLK
jgi:hypothetical protein